jgi:hypothetical protein
MARGYPLGDFLAAVEGEGWTFGRKIPQKGVHKIIVIENNKKAGAADPGKWARIFLIFPKKILDKRNNVI